MTPEMSMSEYVVAITSKLAAAEKELTELRQYQRDTDIYVQKMEDNQDYHLRVIRNLNSELAAAQARVKELEAHNAERNERTFERNAQAHRD